MAAGERRMTAASDLARMVPGFDFLQGLMKNAGAGLPNMGQWIAPTLNPEELEKRIQELKTVQFWLEQNARLLGTTIQALEVQRMTLSTLQSMNLPMADLAESLKIKPASVFAPTPAPEPEPEPQPRKAPVRKAAAPAPAAKKAAAPAVDPVQWWGALTQQFTELATQAMKDTGADAAKTLAGSLVKQSVDSAAGALKKAAAMPAQAAAGLAGAAVRVAAPRKSSNSSSKRKR
jgi:hypothetical protein